MGVSQGQGSGVGGAGQEATRQTVMHYYSPERLKELVTPHRTVD